MRPRVRFLLFGRDPTLSRRFLGVAVAMGVLVVVAYELVLSETLGGVVFLPGPLAVAMVVPAAYHAYRNDGLLVCLALGALPGKGFDVFHYVLGIGYRPLGERLVLALQSQWFLVAGLVLGALGFALGAGARRAVRTLGARRGASATG